jgi:hypothetical protein
MEVTYLGNAKNMISYGYDFSDGPVDVPETDTFAIKKYLGNRHFYCDHVDNFGLAPSAKVAPIPPGPEAPEDVRVVIGVFKKKEDGKPYSRPEKVFTGSDEDWLKKEAAEWMAEKEINPDDRLIMVK